MLLNVPASVDVFFSSEPSIAQCTLGQKGLRADESLWKGFVGQTLDWEWLNLAIWKQHFQVCRSKVFNVQATSDAANPEW